MKKKYFFDEYDQFLPLVKKQFQKNGYQFVEIDNHFCFIKDDKIYWHILNQPLKNFILYAKERKARAEYIKSKISPQRKRYNSKYLTIAKQILAMQFRHAIIENTIYLTSQFNTEYPLYIIQKSGNKFNVMQINKDLVQQFKNTEYFQKVLDFIWSEYSVVAQNDQLIKNKFIFNQKQLYDYFVNKCYMNIVYFKQLFSIENNYQYNVYNYNKIDVFVKNDYTKINDVKKVINLTQEILNQFNKIKRICIIFQNLLKQNQGIAYGNCVDNDFYDSVITITDLNPQYVILHQLGHIYEAKYLKNDDIEKLYSNFIENKLNLKYHDTQILKKQQFIAQLFAQYYMYGFNEKFCKQFLFKN